MSSINHADLIVTSDLLRIETARAIGRVLNENLITPEQHESLIRHFHEFLKSWFRMSIDESVINGASENFPMAPVRSLDAIHLATALEYKKLYPELKMLTSDDRLLQKTTALDL